MIMSDGYPELEVFIHSAFCARCNGSTTLVDYKSFLDDTNDIILEGECMCCRGPVTRYIETGGSRRSAAVARHIRYVHALTDGRNQSL